MRAYLSDPADLREKIRDYDITKVLNTKPWLGKSKEIQTSLICLDIFRSFGRHCNGERHPYVLAEVSLDQDGPWTRELIAKSLDHLRNPEWKIQKAGVITLSALAQTGMDAVPHFLDESLISSLSLDYGPAAIKDRLPEIVEMLLPAGYLFIASTSTIVPSSTPGGARATKGETLGPARVQTMLPDSPSKQPSSILAPACALRILAQNREYSEIPFGET